MTRSLKDFHKDDANEALREALASHSEKSESQLFSELDELTRQERAAGRMDNMVMDDIYEKLAPMLSEKQKEKMREVLARLKE